MKAVQWLINEHFGGLENCTPHFRKHIEQAIQKETELLLHVIKCYHNNLFFVPLNENGEAEAILELILSGQIKSKLDI
jgi:nucleoside-triphosphatase THEP1